MNVTVRGLLPLGMKMRENAKLKQGRWNEPGKREVVVGEGIAARYPAARVGNALKFGRGMWQVVGEFSDGDSAANSEIWADLNQLRGDFEQQGGCNSVLVRLETASTVPEAFKESRRSRPAARRLACSPNRGYYKRLTKTSTKSSSGIMLQFIGLIRGNRDGDRCWLRRDEHDVCRGISSRKGNRNPPRDRIRSLRDSAIVLDRIGLPGAGRRRASSKF